MQRAGANQQIVAGVKINGINGGIAAQDAADLFQIITEEKDAVNISFAAGVSQDFLPGISIAEKVDGSVGFVQSLFDPVVSLLDGLDMQLFTVFQKNLEGPLVIQGRAYEQKYEICSEEKGGHLDV